MSELGSSSTARRATPGTVQLCVTACPDDDEVVSTFVHADEKTPSATAAASAKLCTRPSSRSEPHTPSWQGRSATRRLALGAVFGGTRGRLMHCMPQLGPAEAHDVVSR